MKLTYQVLLLFVLVILITGQETTEENTQDEKTEMPAEPEEEIDVSVQPIDKKKKKNKPKDGSEENDLKKQPQILELPNFPFSPYPEFYYPTLKQDFVPPGQGFYNPFGGYPALSPRFGGQFPGIPILLPELPKKDKSKEKEKSKGNPKEDDDDSEMEGSGEDKEDSEDDGKKRNKKDDDEDKDNGKPKISIIRVLQLPVLPVLRGPWSPQPRLDTVPWDSIPNTIGYDPFGSRVANPWYNGPFLGRGFTPQIIFRR